MNEPSVVAEHQPASAVLARVAEQISRALVGQREVVEHVLMALFAGGHVLLEGVPGLGKTLLVRALAKTFGGAFARIQFTPDLMPSDVSGHALYDLKSQEFRVRKGPVFTHLLLADEINRAPAKTQAALLEVMQEGQVTIEGQSFELPRPFMVLATQNPIEQEGTYPLPEAQLERFLLKVLIRYPEAEEEGRLVRQVTAGQVGDALDVSLVETVITAGGRGVGAGAGRGHRGGRSHRRVCGAPGPRHPRMARDRPRRRSARQHRAHPGGARGGRPGRARLCDPRRHQGRGPAGAAPSHRPLPGARHGRE